MSIHQRSLDIIQAPSPNLTIRQSWLVKTLLLGLGHLITIESNGDLAVTNDPAIFALNHSSYLESLLVPAFLMQQRDGRKISFVIDWMFGQIPLLGWLFKQIDPIYAYHKKSTIPALNRFRTPSSEATVYEQCISRLTNGRSIGIFPEGTRNSDPERLLPGRKGIGYIALKSGSPILPIGIDFPTRLSQKRIPEMGRLILRIGHQMEFQSVLQLFRQLNTQPGLNGNERKKIADYLASKVTFAVMSELAKLSGKQYPFPAPVLPGFLEKFVQYQNIIL